MINSGKKYKIVFNELVYIDLKTIDKYFCLKIKEVIENKLTFNPDIFGNPLRSNLKGFRKLRVGDYRVVYRTNSTTVFIELIGHRKDVYSVANKRLK